MKYIGITGSREFIDKVQLYRELDLLKDKYQYITLVSGGARGADYLAEQYAKLHNLNMIIYEADFTKDKYQGYSRNTLIANKCDILIACLVAGLPCNGTRDTIAKVMDLDKPIIYIGVSHGNNEKRR